MCSTHWQIYGAGSFSIDFGTESAGWLEIESPDMPEDVYAQLLLSLSETDTPYKFDSSGLANKVSLRTGVCLSRHCHSVSFNENSSLFCICAKMIT